jgi:hypothetical protein
MGKLMSNFGTQAKERARQQKQTDKASKRMLARRQRAHAKTSAPKTGSETAEPIFTDNIVGKPLHPSTTSQQAVEV